MQVKFWRGFRKRPNSTSVPAAAQATNYNNVVLTESCDILNPVLIMNNFDVNEFTYAQIPAFGDRYYFVRNISYEKNLTFIYLEEDFLASYREAILNSTNYVLRSASDHNGWIIDTMFPTLPYITHHMASAASPFTEENFIIQTESESGVRSFLLNKAKFADLCDSLWYQWESLPSTNDLFAHAIDPMQYIIGIQKVYTPASFWSNTIANVPIKLGLFDIKDGFGASLTGLDVTNAKGHARVTISPLPVHPQAADRPFAAAAPFSVYSIRIGGIGWIDIPANDLFGSNYIYVDFTAEGNTGNMRVDIIGGSALPVGSESVIATATGKVSTPWAVGASSVNVGGAISGAASTIGAIASGNFVGAINGIGNAINGLTPTVSSIGGATGAVGMDDPILFQAKFQHLAPDNNAEHGRPLMQTRLMSTLSGFTICDNADFYSAPLTEENSSIESYLNGGFYIE